MAERPIIFSTPMVRAIVAGRKTQTRRVVTGAPSWATSAGFSAATPDGHVSFRGAHPVDGQGEKFIRSPYGITGDLLWVREAGSFEEDGISFYRADQARLQRENPELFEAMKWTPSIHMPKWAARIWLEVIGVSVERVQDITEADALAEGLHSTATLSDAGDDYSGLYASDRLAELWDELYGKRGYGWDQNPYVWVISFKALSTTGRPPAIALEVA